MGRVGGANNISRGNERANLGLVQQILRIIGGLPPIAVPLTELESRGSGDG